MRKKTLIKTIIAMAIIVILFSAAILMNRYIIIPIPSSDYDEEMIVAHIKSPDNTQSIELRHISVLDGNDKVLSEYTLLETIGMEDNSSKYIYYSKGLIPLSDIFWIDDNTIKISDVELNVNSSVYDYRIHFWK